VTTSVSITEANVFKAMGDFITSIVPPTCKVMRGQTNRVAQPANSDHVVMWPILRPRLATNESAYTDIAFNGSISGLVLTVSQMIRGSISQGLVVSGQGVALGTQIGTQISGAAGGPGTYNVSPTQNVTSTVMQAGYRGALQRTQVDIQIDIHGPASADNAQAIATLLRDSYATELFAASGFDVQPLYVNDPKQIPFVNGEQQVEERWTLDAVLQANPVVNVQQQFAGALSANLTNVDRAYPPA
jgi:hypothetical protein